MNHKYRKKPVEIEAFQFTEEAMESYYSDNWPDWLCAAFKNQERSDKARIWQKNSSDQWMCGTLEGPHEITFNDWIIQGVKGEIYPCKPDIFEMTYDPVDAEPEGKQLRGVE
jgi:hypothetical protein